MPRFNILLFIALVISMVGACTPPDDTLPTLAVVAPPVTADAIGILKFWEAQSGRLDTTSEIDTFQFSASANDQIRLGAVEEGQPVQITLLDSTGTILASGDAIEATLTSDGVYRVQLQTLSAGASNYTLGLSYTDRPNPNQATPIEIVVGIPTPTPDFGDLGSFISAMTPNARVNNSLTAQAPRHIYTLDVPKGTFFTVEMARISGTVDPLLRLYSPTGDLLALDDNSGGNRTARLLNIKALDGGVYRIQAEGRATYGDYQLSVKTDFQNPVPDALPTLVATPETPFATPTIGVLATNTRLVDHIPVIGTIDNASGFRNFSFYADQGDVLTVGVAPFGDSGLRPFFEVYDPEGALIVQGKSSTSNDGGGAYVTGIPIAESGAYILIVMGEDDSQGGFTVSYGRGVSRQDNFKGEALANTRLTSVLVPKGLRDTWLVRLQVGDVITVAATSPDKTIDPVVELADLNGNVLYSDDNSGGDSDALIRSAQINQSGQYLLRVLTARGDQVGNYTLVWRYINLAPSPTPIPQKVSLLSISDDVKPTEYQFYTFFGLQGQIVNIQVIPRAGSQLDPLAVLLDAQGNQIAQGDDDNGTLNPNFTVLLPADGTYTVRVNGYLSGGLFDLVVKWLF